MALYRNLYSVSVRDPKTGAFRDPRKIWKYCFHGMLVALWRRELKLPSDGGTAYGTKERCDAVYDSLFLLVLWLLGVIGHVGGGLIHLLLVVALVVFIINLSTGRNADCSDPQPDNRVPAATKPQRLNCNSARKGTT
jgi:hypothetical protein